MMVDEAASDVLRSKRKRPASRGVRNGERPSQKGRKLKQYVLEEKLDIIDYAKLIYVASTAGAESPLTWHRIKEKANDIWNEICERDADFKEKDFSANMGWVARFVKRNNIQLPAPSSPSVTPDRYEEPVRPVEPLKADGIELRKEASAVDSVQPHQSNTEAVTQTLTSPKRRRKNFTPKKLVEHPVIESQNILLETISESKSAPSGDAPQNVTVVAMSEEDENIDVCF